jgi:hypothetical protein
VRARQRREAVAQHEATHAVVAMKLELPVEWVSIDYGSDEGTHFTATATPRRRRVLPAVRGELGGDAFPYLCVPEWHPGGHGLHVHFAVGRLARARSKSICGNRGSGLETGKTYECQCCDDDCRDRDHGSKEPHFPGSPRLKPPDEQERTDHDCELERCRHCICDAHGLRLTGPWSERQPGRSRNEPRHCDERVAESSKYVDRARGIAHDRDHPAQLSQSYGHEEHSEEPVLREVLIDDGEVDRGGTGRRDRDRDAKHLGGLGGTTCADADRNERDS